MLQTLLLLGALPLLASPAYARYQTEARISLFEASATKEASSLTNLDCDASKPSTSVGLQINDCLWGDYNLVNNFKITQYPKCANGHDAVALFYATTSCTGIPTFRSDNYVGDLEDKCLFGSSSEKWSVVFRCGNTKTQAIQRRRFIQAVPPPPTRKTFKAKPKAMDGVVTPYGSYDCSIYRPKEPTYLPADACLPLDKSHSLLIHEPAICGDGRVALVNTYEDEECTESRGWLGSDAHSDAYYPSINKNCHTTNAGSMMFQCGRKEDMVMFKDLPEQQFKKVKELRIIENVRQVRPKPKLSPPIVTKPGKEVPILDDGPKSGIEKTYKKEGTTNRIGAQGGTLQPFYLDNCKNDRAVSPVIKPVDTCVWTFMWKSLRVKSPAICPNGTQALFATYTRPGCKAAELISVGKIPEAFTSGCGDINNIDSVAFICEGLPASEIGNKGSIGGLIKTLLIILLIVVLMIGLSILSCCLRGAAMMQQANLLWGRITSLFGKREGEIQL
ncbi:hypothetical protein BGZ60DRAFT_531235 [Tricladium varicosporioides]|nr:hypothetical protein BGZ60DRAFT_531235 [Hymenoscyphus varicosporioides]